jgi:hypothetical protein
MSPAGIASAPFDTLPIRNLRVRYKRLEEMPLEQRCCPENIAAMSPYCGQERTVELWPRTQRYTRRCPYCGTPETNTTIGCVAGTNIRVAAEHVDIDEGA